MTHGIIDHVRLHLEKRSQMCRLCSHQTFTKIAICQHILTVHKMKDSRQYYVDLTEKYYDVIKEIIERSFLEKHKELTADDCKK